MRTMAFNPGVKSQEAVIQFYRQCYSVLNVQWNLREQLRQADLTYMREVDMTEEQFKARKAVKAGNPTKFQNVVMPVVMPQVEAAVVYQQSVFLSGYPIFGVVSYPEFANEALMMDTIIGEQQLKGRWVTELLKVMRNGFKYNIAAVECSWERETTYSIAGTDANGRGKPQEVIWEGNRLKALDMYNTFWDTRCLPHEVHTKGEFAGYTELMSRVALKQYIDNLPTKINVTEALESAQTAQAAAGGTGIESYYVPSLNPEALYDHNIHIATTDWMAWAGLISDKPRINYKNLYELTTLYARILPSDFGFTGVPAPNTPQVWKFVIVNNQVLIHVERLTNAHNKLPILFYQPIEDGLGYQTKSFAKNVEPMQEIVTALANSSIAVRRRAVADRMLYDPSRVSKAAIENDSPTARIPVRPSAYQDDLSKSVYPIPFRDDLFQINGAEMQQYLSYSNVISGLNPARQGQFVKGNKTRFEFGETMQYANGRDQAIAMATESSFFTPLKEIIKLNILQYQTNTRYFNIEEQNEIEIDPVSLRKANLAFKISDGLLPSEKLMDGESMGLAFQTLASVPQLAQAYNLAPMFSYMMKMRGAKLQPFEKSAEQLAYEQALASWQESAMQIAMAIQEAAKHAEPKMSPEDLQAMAEQLVQQNPMPQPEDYGFDPAKPTLSKENPLNPESKSILSSVQETISNASQQSQGMQGNRGDI